MWKFLGYLALGLAALWLVSKILPTLIWIAVIAAVGYVAVMLVRKALPGSNKKSLP